MRKEHKKLYKAGKNWLVATITGTAVTLMGTQIIHADTNEETSNASSTQTVRADNYGKQDIQQQSVNIAIPESYSHENDGIIATPWPASAEENSSKTENNTTVNKQQDSQQVDSNAYGTVNVKDWDYQNVSNTLNLTGYHGHDTRHVVVPNLNDFYNQKIDIGNATAIGITSNFLKQNILSECKTLAISRTYGNLNSKVIALNSNWEKTFSNTKLIKIDLANLDTKNITNMSNLFNSNSNLKTIEGIGEWDTSNVTDMSCMFYSNESLEKIDSLAKWDTSNVTNMSCMFCHDTQLKELNGISKWNTSKVVDMTGMFEFSSLLTNVGDISQWNLRELKKIGGIFDSPLPYIYICDNAYDITPNKVKVVNQNGDLITTINTPIIYSQKLNYKYIIDQLVNNEIKELNKTSNFLYSNPKIDPKVNIYNLLDLVNGTYIVNQETINKNKTGSINYVDQNGKVIKTDTISGNVGDTINLNILLPDGYEVADSDTDLPTTVTVAASGIPTITINVKHQIIYIDQWNIPTEYDKSQFLKEVTRTIVINTPQQKPKDIVQKESIYRNGTLDRVTKKVTFGDWSTSEFKPVTISAPLGYKADYDTIPAEKIDSNTKDSTIEINCIPLDQTVSVYYIAQAVLVKTDNISGKTGQTIEYQIKLPNGYKLDSSQSAKVSYTFTGYDNQSMSIYIEPIIMHLDSTTPANKLPDNFKLSDFSKTITRTITLEMPNGKLQEVKQEVTLTRAADYNEGTKEANYTNWTTGKFNLYKAPVIQGYIATQPVVNSMQIDHDTDDQFVVINYIANRQYGHINYIDENGKVIKTDTVSGVVGTSIPVKIVIPDGYELAKKDEQLPTTIKIDNEQLQDLTIKVKKNVVPSQPADNQVPQDNTTQNNQLNFNQGWLDNYGLTQTKDGLSQIKASGWHAVGQSNQDSYRYMIVYDNTLRHEIARQKLIPVVRNDVRQAYSNITNSNYSGFDMTIDIPTSAINHSLSLVARYSDDAVNGEGQHVDYWFGPLKMDDSNQGYLDSIKSDGKTVTVSGWHATNQAANRPYHYIIAFDQTLGHEIARQKVESVQRPDVAKVYGKIANAINSGYSAKFNLTSQYFNDNIQFLSRWTDDPNGNGNSVDYWFNPVNRINRANLDSVDLSSGELKVAGWHATDMSEFEPNHFLIVFDNTTGQQVASQKVELESSADVAKVYSDTRTANYSRFNFNFGALNLQSGHNYSLVSRYSTDSNGNGNDGAHTDSWLNMGTFNQKAHNIDSTILNGNTLTFQGWMADDQATIKQYPYAILLQDGKEIARQQLDLTARPDVAKVYPRLYQSKKSGFNVSFKLPTVSLDNLQLVLRFTDSQDGNGNTSDAWIDVNRGMIKKI